jgi:exopolysaccharide biosynthesis polyprenyl glycosylphosphotransferase
MALTDALSLLLAIVLTRYLRYGLKPAAPGFAIQLLFSALVWLAVFAGFQLYSLSRLSPAEEFRRLVEASAAAAGVKLALGLVLGRTVFEAVSRGWLLLAWFVALVLVLVTRRMWHMRMGKLRTRGELAYRTLIVGTNDESARIARTLAAKPGLGFAPVGFLHTHGDVRSPDGLPVLGTVTDVAKVIEDNQIECLFVASSAVKQETMRRFTRDLRRSGVEVRISANVTDILSSRLTVQPVGDLLTLSLRPVRIKGTQAVMKRTFDLMVGGLAMLTTSPLWIGAALLIKLTSRGPIFFRQERIGRDFKPFVIYKFRTMVQGAETMLPGLEGMNEASGPLFKMRHDPRITRVGRLLRRHSIDELPQLINVMKGDMSLVGPRPPLPREVAEYDDWHRGRIEVKPGITGLWQVAGRSELSFDDYVRLDLFYIENWSILYDLYIIGRTIPAVLLRKGAF